MMRYKWLLAMADPIEFDNPEPEEVIKWLLSDNKSQRKTALSYISEHWDIQFREFLWKAIEEETDISLQVRMVKVALKHLQERSIRKMIRFLEKGQLVPRARRTILDTYFTYENEEIRIALIKSILRPKSKIRSFVCSLLQQQLQQLANDDIEDLLTTLFAPDIPHREEYLITTMQRYFTQPAFKEKLDQCNIWSLISTHGDLYALILQHFFNKSVTSQFTCTKKITKQQLVWENFTWQINCAEGRNCMKERMGMYEDHVMAALSHRSPLVRLQAIKLLGQQTIATPYPEEERQRTTFLQNLYHVWDDLIIYDFDETLLNAEDTFFESLSRILEHQGSQAETLQESSTENAETLRLFEKLEEMQIYPATIAELILATLPRKYLLSMIENDPNRDNRLLAYQELQNPLFWYNQMNIGPPQVWLNVIKRCLRALIHEPDDDIQYASHKLLRVIMVQLVQSPDDPVTEKVVQQLPSLKSLATELPDTIPATLARNSIFSVIGEQTIPVSQAQVPAFATAQVLSDLFQRIGDDGFLQSLENLITANHYEFYREILSKIDEMLQIQALDDHQKSKLLELLQILTRSDDARIRTKAVFYMQKLRS